MCREEDWVGLRTCVWRGCRMQAQLPRQLLRRPPQPAPGAGRARWRARLGPAPAASPVHPSRYQQYYKGHADCRGRFQRAINTPWQVPRVWPSQCRKAQGFQKPQHRDSKVSVTATPLQGPRQPHKWPSYKARLGCHAQGGCSRQERGGVAAAHPVGEQRPAVLGPQALVCPDLAQHGVALLQGAARGSSLGRRRSLRPLAALQSALVLSSPCLPVSAGP